MQLLAMAHLQQLLRVPLLEGVQTRVCCLQEGPLAGS